MQDLFQALIQSDRQWFHHINQEWTLSGLDRFMPFITNFRETLPYLLVVVLLIIWKKKMKAIPIILGCVLCVGLADVTAARVIKPLVQRDRPEQTEKTVRLLVPSQKSFGFPSNHAANVFAAATFLMFTVPAAGLIAWVVAFLVAYSRIYVGVHYPLDVIGGAFLGIICSFVLFNLYSLAYEFANPVRPEPIAPTAWERRKYAAKLKRKKKKPPIMGALAPQPQKKSPPPK